MKNSFDPFKVENVASSNENIENRITLVKDTDIPLLETNIPHSKRIKRVPEVPKRVFLSSTPLKQVRGKGTS